MTLAELLESLTPEAQKKITSAPKMLKELESTLAKIPAEKASMFSTMARSAVAPMSAALEVIPAFEKYGKKNPEASLKETALSPEGSKGLARGVGAAVGSEIGGALGASLPVPSGLKPGTAIAGAVVGAASGVKLADLLTGIPYVDKIIKENYEKELRKRESKMVQDLRAGSSVEVTPITEFIPE